MFFERLTAAFHVSGEEVLPVVRYNAERANRLRETGLVPVQLRFGGWLDPTTRFGLRRVLRRFAPQLVMAWMGRAASQIPSGDWVLAGRLGGYYDLRRFRHCDHLVANTHGLVRWIQAQGWPADRVHHLPNFVPDLVGAAPARLPVPQGARVVLALGRLHRNKAFDVLVRALPRLPNVHAVIAGDGPERDALLELARCEGVGDRLHLLGWRSDQAALLAAADVLACPSRQEALGNVVIEAFSARVPVVAAAIGGPLELIQDGTTGLLTPSEDASALAERLQQVLFDHVMAARLSNAARAAFEAEHAEAQVMAYWRATLARLAPG